METRIRYRGSDEPVVVESVTRSLSSKTVRLYATHTTRDKPASFSARIVNNWGSDPAFSQTVTFTSSMFNWRVDPYNGRYYITGVSSTCNSSVKTLLAPLLASTNYLTSCLPPSGKVQRVVGLEYEYMEDVVGSGFNKRRKEEFVVNPLYKEMHRFVLQDASEPSKLTYSVNCIWGGSGTIIDLTVSASTFVPFPKSAFNVFRDAWIPAVDVTDYGFLYSSACKQISEGDMEIVAAIGELRETTSYLFSKMQSIGRILKAVMNRDLKFFKNLKSPNPGDFWLEARYAIRPLFYDVQSILAVLRSEGKLHNTVRKADVRVDEATSGYSHTFTDNNVEYVVKGEHAYEYVARGGAYARLTMDLDLAYRMGSTNIASGLWELVPYSFIIDWFFSVSSFIAGLNPNPIYEVQAGYVSISRRDFLRGTITVNGNGKTQSFGFSDAVQRRVRQPYDNRFAIALDLNLNFHKFVDLALIFGRR